MACGLKRGHYYDYAPPPLISALVKSQAVQFFSSQAKKDAKIEFYASPSLSPFLFSLSLSFSLSLVSLSISLFLFPISVLPVCLSPLFSIMPLSLLEVYLPCEPVCWLVFWSVHWMVLLLVGLSFSRHFFLQNGRQFNFHGPIRTLVYICI